MEIISIIKEKTERLIQQGFQTDAGGYIRKGWDIFRKDMGIFIGYTVIMILIISVASIIPFAALLIGGPLNAGFFIVADRVHKGEAYEFKTFFRGFDFFVPLMLYMIVSTIFILLGFVALIIPGIYLCVAYTFAPLYIVFGKLEFWDGMEYSRRLVTRKWWSIFGFLILLGLINIAGMLALLVGLFFTIPLTYCAIYAAFDEIVGTG